MDRPLLPPDFVNVEPEWLYELHEIPAATKIFYMQVRGLAWGKDCTPWLTMDELEEITGKKKSVIWGYMSTLRTSRRLLWRTAIGRGFMFTFPEKEAHSESSDLLRKFGTPSTTTVLKDSKPSSKEEVERTPKNRSTPKVRSGTPSNPREAMDHPDIRVFRDASGRVPGSAQYRMVIETINLLRGKYGVEDRELAELLKPYWTAWSSRKRTDGNPYNPSAVTWLTEWAINEHIPPVSGNAKSKLDIDSILGV